MKFKRAIALIMIFAVVFSFSACGSKNESDPKTLVIAIQDEIEGTDIQQIGWDNVVHQMLYSPLVTFSDDLSTIEPCFAESYSESEDGKEVTFVLPEGAKFSNGDTLDAEAVKASFLRMKEISQYSGDIEAVTDIQVVDERTVKFILSEPAPYMWASLGSSFSGIVNTAVADEVGNDEFNRNAVSNGPFMVKEWKAGSEIVLEKNPNYVTANPSVENKGVMNFDTVIVRFIPDEFTRVSELESGNVDIAYDIPTSSVKSITDNEDLEAYFYEQAGATYMMTQTDDEPLNDKNIRDAINVGIDREALAEALDGQVSPLYGFISKAQAGYSADKEAEYAEKFAYNPEKAKELLAAAGYTDSDGDGIVDKNGTPLTIEYCSPTDKASNKAAAPVIQAQLKEIGIDLQITEYEAAYIKQLQKENNFQMMARSYVWNDADIMYYVFTEESGYPWHEQSVTDALVAARYETDPAQRVVKYEEAQDTIFQYTPAISMFADKYCIATTKEVKGFKVTNDGRSIFNDTTKE